MEDGEVDIVKIKKRIAEDTPSNMSSVEAGGDNKKL